MFGCDEQRQGGLVPVRLVQLVVLIESFSEGALGIVEVKQQKPCSLSGIFIHIFKNFFFTPILHSFEIIARLRELETCFNSKCVMLFLIIFGMA